MPSSLLLEKLKELPNSQDVGTAKNLADMFMRLHAPEDCFDEDCDPVVCSVCGGRLSFIFGSLPLRVKCIECAGEFALIDLLAAL